MYVITDPFGFNQETKLVGIILNIRLILYYLQKTILRQSDQRNIEETEKHMLSHFPCTHVHKSCYQALIFQLDKIVISKTFIHA